MFSSERAAVLSGATGLPDTERAVFVVETTPTAQPEWVSVTSAGAAGTLASGTTGEALAPPRAVSTDCSRVAFRSSRALDGVSRTGTFVRDRKASTTVRASFSDGLSDKIGHMGISPDGTTVTFHDNKEARPGGPPFTNPQEVWAYDVGAGSRRWITDAMNTQFNPGSVLLDGGGGHVAIHAISFKTLMGGSYTTTCTGNCLAIVDTKTKTARVDVSLAGTVPSANANSTKIFTSRDGKRVVALMGRAIYWVDVASGESRLINPARDSTVAPTSGDIRSVDVNDDGRYVAFDFSGPTLTGPMASGRPQIYRYDATSKTLELITVNADGTLPRYLAGTVESFPSYTALSIDGSGRVIAFAASEYPQYGNGLAPASNDPRVTGLWIWDDR